MPSADYDADDFLAQLDEFGEPVKYVDGDGQPHDFTAIVTRRRGKFGGGSSGEAVEWELAVRFAARDVPAPEERARLEVDGTAWDLRDGLTAHGATSYVGVRTEPVERSQRDYRGRR